MKINVLTIIIILQGCTPISQSSLNSVSNPKELSFTDFIYEDPIRTVLLHPSINDSQASLQPAVTALGEPNLVLQFDDLSTQRDNFYARIIHCNFDWTKSTLMDLDYMTQFNEFAINNFEYSADTHVPYVHYWFPLPPVKRPGNYLLVVYRGSNKDDLILSKRFMVHDRQMTIGGERNLVGAGNVARLNQQLNFTVNYKNLDIINPLENVKVVVRQNQRWDNLSSDIRPSFVREIEKQLEYRFFDDAKMFKGGNEFRFFDMRSLISPGRNVAKVDKSAKPYEVYIQRDKSRADEAYGQYMDMNGGFILDNFDYRDASFSNYAFVNFSLASRNPVPGDVFVTGAFHQWNQNEENLMYYDSTKHEYTGRILLKQGWYDYQYLVRSEELPPYFLEGSHFETENSYEIFVYYRSFQPRADLLLGYQRFEKNQR
jgi:hypothetical protein